MKYMLFDQNCYSSIHDIRLNHCSVLSSPNNQSSKNDQSLPSTTYESSSSLSSLSPSPSNDQMNVKPRNVTLNIISGALSGFVSAITVAPLDVIKTRLIVQRTPKHLSHEASFTGIIPTAKKMIKNEGFGSLYKGLGSTLFGYVPNWAIYFSAYERLKSYFSHKIKNDTWNHVISSMAAGAITNCITSPIWVVKIRFQTQVGTSEYRNTFHALYKIGKKEGIGSLYRGLAPSLVGLFHVGIQFPLYENLKTRLISKNENSEVKYTDVILASSVSKAVASVIAYPHEVIRSRMQDHISSTTMQAHKHLHFPYDSISHAVDTIWKHEGYHGFYKGMGTNLVRVIPSAVITLLSFEMAEKYLGNTSMFKKKEVQVKE